MGKRGKAIDDKTKERLLSHYATFGSYTDTGREFGVSEGSVRKYVKDAKAESDAFTELYETKRKENIEEANEWSKGIISKMQQSIESALDLGNKKISQALLGEENFKDIIDNILSSDMEPKDKASSIKNIAKLTDIQMSQISTYVGTLYDKQALENGKPTSRSDNTNKDTVTVNVNKLENYFK